MMYNPQFAVQRPVAITMMALSVVVFGVLSFFRLPLQLMPDITYPTLTVRTEYPGAAPLDVERNVSRKIEEVLSTTSHLQSMTAVSTAGVSEIKLTFSWQAHFDRAVQDVREKLERLSLRRDVGQPLILRYDPSLEPILRIAFVPKTNQRFSVLKKMIERQLKAPLTVLDGVAAVKIKGGRDAEIVAALDQFKLANLAISVADVKRRIRQEQVDRTGGMLRSESNEFIIRTQQRLKSLEAIRNVVIKTIEGADIRLRDIATVAFRNEEEDVIVRVNQKKAVAIEVFKEATANVVAVSTAVRKRIDVLKGKWGPSFTRSIVSDQAVFVSRAIDELKNSALLGGLLAMLVLFLFLQRVGPTLVIGVSIPTSILASFALMHVFDVSLNTMSLGGLALGVGMMVDNAIVVLENIARVRGDYPSNREAAIAGSKEVLTAVVASTLTTIAVFFPIVFVDGLAGQIFNDFALAVIFSLFASLLVAVFVIPMLAGRQLNIMTGFKVRKTIPIGATINRLGRQSVVFYSIILKRAMVHPKSVLSGVLLSFMAAVFYFLFSSAELLPTVHQGILHFDVTLKVGTPIAVTEKRMAALEEHLASLQRDSQNALIIGVDRGEASGVDRGPHTARIIVQIKRNTSVALRDRENAVRHAISTILDREQGMAYTVSRPSLFYLGHPLQLELYCENLVWLKRINAALLKTINRQHFDSISSSLKSGFPELLIVFKKEVLAFYGLSADAISKTIAAKVRGEVAVEIQMKTESYHLRVKQAQKDMVNIDAIRRMVVARLNNRAIRLSTIADVRIVEGPSEIRHLRKRRGTLITADLKTDVDLKKAVDALRQSTQSLVDRYRKSGVSVAFRIGGDDAERGRSERALLFALLLAIFLVYVVMASQFESFLQPFIILFSIPLAGIGSAVLLGLTHHPVNIMVFIGFIMLAGIVVNNAIVLIDSVNQRRDGSVDRSLLVVDAAQTRLRPILMTTATTVLGLLPMALGMGEGAELRTPMALTVIGGLLSATMLTLIVIPVIVHELERWRTT